MTRRYLGLRPVEGVPADAFFQSAIFQRAPGPYPSGPLRTLELWEQRAVEILRRFQEADGSSDNDIGLPVCGEWKFYSAPDDEADERLCSMAAALWAINDAFEQFEALRLSPSYEVGAAAAWACMTAVSMLSDVGVTTSDTWMKGEKAEEHAIQRGEATKKATSQNDEFLLQAMYAKHKGSKGWLKGMTDDFNRGKPERDRVSTKTVSRRLKEIGLR